MANALFLKLNVIACRKLWGIAELLRWMWICILDNEEDFCFSGYIGNT